MGHEFHSHPLCKASHQGSEPLPESESIFHCWKCNSYSSLNRKMRVFFRHEQRRIQISGPHAVHSVAAGWGGVGDALGHHRPPPSPRRAATALLSGGK